MLRNVLTKHIPATVVEHADWRVAKIRIGGFILFAGVTYVDAVMPSLDMPAEVYLLAFCTIFGLDLPKLVRVMYGKYKDDKDK